MRQRAADLTAALIALATLAAGLRWGTFTAGGADSYAYVSQAFLWTRGTLVEHHAFADLAARFGEWTFVPLGYRPGAEAGTFVPVYPPGFPLTMAAAALLAGPSAVYLVVPLLGAVAVLLTYRLGAALDGLACGRAAAALLATSPIFLYQLVQPMSDVPAATWWLASMLLAARASAASAVLAGLAASMAILTRPNLLVLTIVPAALLIGNVGSPNRAGKLRRLASFLAATLPGCLAVAALNARLYGSPLHSGYGTLGELYALEHVGPNLARYTRWLVETQTLFPLLALGAPFVRRRDADAGEATASPGPRTTGLVIALAATVALVLASYLPYAPFDDWWYLRFLLPGWPPLLVLATLAGRRLLQQAGRRWRARLGGLVVPTLAFAAGVAGLVVWQTHTAVVRGAFDLHELERRYRDTGEAVRDSFPERALFLAAQQSGSLRLYGERTTVRWDTVPGDALDDLLRVLAAHGWTPYLLVEGPEERAFRERFAEASAFGRLDWPPALEVRGAVTVRVYDPRDRARYFAGERVNTRLVAPWRRRGRGVANR